MIARRCNRRCHPVRPVTRLIAPCGISKPRSAVCRPMLPPGIDRIPPVATAYTISLDTPEAMHEAVRKASGRPILKIKARRAGR